MRWLVTEESGKYYYPSNAYHPSSEQVQFTLLKAMLQYSINFTDNTNVIIDILDLISKEMNVHKAICVKERYTYCFTYAVHLLLTCICQIWLVTNIFNFKMAYIYIYIFIGFTVILVNYGTNQRNIV
jgi:hypothetical protein